MSRETESEYHGAWRVPLLEEEDRGDDVTPPRPAGLKERPEDLALFGGPRAFPEPLHVGRPNLGDAARFEQRMREILTHRWFTNDGVFVKDFERKVAAFLGVEHCIATCSGTIALEIAIRALGLTGEVIIPSFTFIATAHALKWHGITPVFCDIDPVTHTIDPEAIPPLITSKTTGIIGVHVWGRPCNVDALTQVADHHGLTLLFDAAHALGCSHRGQMVGSFGRAEILSFHATKVVNSFEGGAVVTNDHELAEQVRLMRNFGFSGYDHVVTVGTNAKMAEICGAMGLTNLESRDQFFAVNLRNHEHYVRCLAGNPYLKLMRYDAAEQNNYQYVVVEVAESCPIGRDVFVEILHAENVLARRYFWPGCHEMEPYRSESPRAGLSLPVTVRVADRVMVLPTGTSVGPTEIAGICNILRCVADNAAEIRIRNSSRASVDRSTGSRSFRR
jgi:dTDP-4-amino-4,6-dideoxygalactose transaminase